MKPLEYFKSISLEEVNQFIEEGQEENLYLEFKTTNFPHHSSKDADKKNLSKSISGFANSGGGIIIWGIEAKSINGVDIASKNRPIGNLTAFLNRLNSLDGTAVSPIVSGILHEKILDGEDTGYIKTFIPASEDAPHMAVNDKRYYKRSGDSFYKCEHYDIRDLFNRNRLAKVKIKVEQTVTTNAFGNKRRYKFIISLYNDGKYFAKAPFLEIDINQPFFFPDSGLDGNGNIGLFQKRDFQSRPQKAIYIGTHGTYIYPHMWYEIDSIRLELPNHKVDFPELKYRYRMMAENMETIIGEEKIIVREGEFH